MGKREEIAYRLTRGGGSGKRVGMSGSNRTLVVACLEGDRYRAVLGGLSEIAQNRGCHLPSVLSNNFSYIESLIVIDITYKAEPRLLVIDAAFGSVYEHDGSVRGIVLSAIRRGMGVVYVTEGTPDDEVVAWARKLNDGNDGEFVALRDGNEPSFQEGLREFVVKTMGLGEEGGGVAIERRKSGRVEGQ